MKPIIAVVVLYEMAPESSPSLCTFRAELAQWPDLADLIDLVVFDNSPAAQALPPGFFGRYLHDGTNPGLAKRYNQALEIANLQGATWLLLLDQDTTLTREYFEEVACLLPQLVSEFAIVAIVPRLTCDGAMRSPHFPQFRKSSSRIDLRQHGVVPGLVRAFNSGALLRVCAVNRIGGFPESYWLDYLDHATFHRLQQGQGRLYLMGTRLEHDMSVHRKNRHENPAHPPRHRNQLAAELQFYREHGSRGEQIGHRLNLLRQATGSLRRGLFGDFLRLVRATFSATETPGIMPGVKR
jgi:GT2 family glycosyltransferase